MPTGMAKPVAESEIQEVVVEIGAEKAKPSGINGEVKIITVTPPPPPPHQKSTIRVSPTVALTRLHLDKHLAEVTVKKLCKH